MPRLILSITVKRRWWVRSYTALVMTFIWSVQGYADPAQVEAFIGRQAKMIGKHGYELRAKTRVVFDA